MIVATAGHVDHGKTALVKALTSVDCDRLAEEKSRGITIRLGYAPWRLPDGSELSFVDVPGHEKLLKTMLSGIGCADGVLMVISAFEGIQPQSIEHMNACRVLGIERMVVAVTFADRVDDLPAAMSPISEWLTQTPYGTAPVVAVSSVTGLGLDALSQVAQRIFQQDAESTHGLAVCLPNDRRFSMPGHGSVVTGSLLRANYGGTRSCCCQPSRPQPSAASKPTAVRQRPWHVVTESHSISILNASSSMRRPWSQSATHYGSGDSSTLKFAGWRTIVVRSRGFAGLPYTLPPSAPRQTSALPTPSHQAVFRPHAFDSIATYHSHRAFGLFFEDSATRSQAPSSAEAKFWTRTHNKNRACIGSKNSLTRHSTNDAKS